MTKMKQGSNVVVGRGRGSAMGLLCAALLLLTLSMSCTGVGAQVRTHPSPYPHLCDRTLCSTPGRRRGLCVPSRRADEGPEMKNQPKMDLK